MLVTLKYVFACMYDSVALYRTLIFVLIGIMIGIHDRVSLDTQKRFGVRSSKVRTLSDVLYKTWDTPNALSICVINTMYTIEHGKSASHT